MQNSVQFSLVSQSCPTLCDPMDCSTPDLPVHHSRSKLKEFTQTHVHWVIDAIQSSHPLSSLFLLPSIFPSNRAFSNELALPIRWPKYWSLSFSISPSNEYSGLISFTIDWFDFLAVQGTLKSFLQHHSSKASILWCSVFFMIQLSHPYMTTGKTIALTRRAFLGKVMSLLFNTLSRFVTAFLPRSKCLLISWLQSPSAVILESKKINCHCPLFQGFPDNSVGKESACNAGLPAVQVTPVQFLGWEDLLEKGWAGEGVHWRRDGLSTPVFLGFPCGSAGKESSSNVGDLGLIPGLGRSPGGGKGYPLQYSGLENSMDCIVHGVAKSWAHWATFTDSLSRWHHPYGRKRNQRSLLMKVKGESKKTGWIQRSKTEDPGIWSHHFKANIGKNGNSDRLYFGGLQNHCRWWLQPWNQQTLAPWKKSCDKPR